MRIMEISDKTKQTELDEIERKILIKLFGKDCIPNKSAILLKMLNIDPNKFINAFENKLSPMMNDNGTINGETFKKIIMFTKYKDLLSIVDIPDSDFYLSEHINSLIKTFIPGGK